MKNKGPDNQSKDYTPVFSILVVDDDLQVATTIRNILVVEGYDVETAQSGRQAIDLLRNCHHFDLVITDMKMPEVDGLEVVRQAREYERHLPVIVMTGYPALENGLQCLEAGTSDYIVKPLEIRTLVSVVRQSLNTHFSNPYGTKLSSQIRKGESHDSNKAYSDC